MLKTSIYVFPSIHHFSFHFILNALSYLDSLAGVNELSFGGAWGPVSFDDPTKAFSFLISNKTPYIAAAEAGLGRAVAFGKEEVYRSN